MDRLLRIILSFACAVAVVGTISTLAINKYFERPKLMFIKAFRVDVADPSLVAQILERENKTPTPPPPPTPAFEWPKVEHNGFVQLQFDVEANGRASNIEVVGAAPAGYYEAQAVDQIKTRRFLPEIDDGKPVVSTRTEIIDFKFTPKVD